MKGTYKSDDNKLTFSVDNSSPLVSVPNSTYIVQGDSLTLKSENEVSKQELFLTRKK